MGQNIRDVDIMEEHGRKFCPYCGNAVDALAARCPHCDSDIPVTAQTADKAALSPGDMAAERYRIVRELGHGRFGTVYIAEKTATGARVALKVYPMRNARERAVAHSVIGALPVVARIRHPNIAAALDGGLCEGYAFVSSELVDGETLSRRLSRGALFEGEAARVISRAALGLSHAHAMHTVHGGIRPGNILLRFGDGEPVLTDFTESLAALDAGATAVDASLFPPEYMAPEFVQTGAPREESDIYALGVVLYEALAGAPPFTGAGAAVRDAQVTQQPPPLETRLPGTSDIMASTVRKLLEKEPRLRFKSGAQLAWSLKPLELARAPRVEPPEIEAPPEQREPVEERAPEHPEPVPAAAVAPTVAAPEIEETTQPAIEIPVPVPQPAPEPDPGPQPVFPQPRREIFPDARAIDLDLERELPVRRADAGEFEERGLLTERAKKLIAVGVLIGIVLALGIAAGNSLYKRKARNADATALQLTRRNLGDGAGESDPAPASGTVAEPQIEDEPGTPDSEQKAEKQPDKPEAGMPLKPGEIPAYPAGAPMPDLTGNTEAEVRRKMKDRGITNFKIEYEDTSNREPDMVLGQSVKPSVRVNPDAPVVIVISRKTQAAPSAQKGREFEFTVDQGEGPFVEVKVKMYDVKTGKELSVFNEKFKKGERVFVPIPYEQQVKLVIALDGKPLRNVTY